MTATGTGSKDDPWVLQTPPRTSEYRLHRDEENDPPVLVCVVGKTTLTYQLHCIEDLHAMLVAHGDWIELGSADEQKPAKADTVEAWARAANNPVGGWYGLKKGLRGASLRTFHRFWSTSGSSSWSTTPETTALGLGDRDRDADRYDG